MAAKAARYSQGTRVLPFTYNVTKGYFLLVRTRTESKLYR